MVVHLAFILLVAFGAVLAWRWPRLLWLHVPALGWAVGIVTVGYRCPFTTLEKALRRRAGAEYEGGFVDRYIEDVVYPDELTPLLRAVAAVLILVGYAGVVHRRRSVGGRLPTVAPGWRVRPPAYGRVHGDEQPATAGGEEAAGAAVRSASSP
jgi:hypothetical protein